MKIFHHNDLDGRCAAFIASAYDPHKDEGPEFIEMNYNYKFPLDKVSKGERVAIVDFSIAPEEMKQLQEVTDDVVWIDHHKTAIDKYKGYPADIRGLRQEVGEAGCELAYRYFTNGDQNMPMWVKYIGDRDTWSWKYGEITKRFCMGCLLYDTSPGSLFWHELVVAPEVRIQQIVEQGALLVRYKEQEAKEVLKSWAYYATFEGLRAIAVNIPQCGSEVFDSVPADSYDVMLSLGWDGTRWTVSIYSRGVDVSLIAKKFGGGGHKGAAGFQCDALPLTDCHRYV